MAAAHYAVRRLGEARLLSLLTGLETGYMLLLDNTFFLDSTESVSLSLEIGRVGGAGRTLKASDPNSWTKACCLLPPSPNTHTDSCTRTGEYSESELLLLSVSKME